MMQSLSDIIQNQDQLFTGMKRKLQESHCFITNFPEFVMQPVTVLPDVFVDAYFLRAYMQCHFAANHLPTLVPLRPEIRLNEQGEYIAIDTTEATLNYRMMHCCRVLENTLRRYALEFEGLRSDLETFFATIAKSDYKKCIPTFPIHYDEDERMWKQIYLSYRTLICRANDLAESFEYIIQLSNDSDITSEAARLLESVTPYRNYLDTLEHKTPGRQHGGFVILDNTVIRLTVRQGFYGSRFFTDFGDDISVLYPSLQSLETITGAPQDPSLPPSGGSVKNWRSHYVVAIPIAGVADQIQESIDGDRDLREITQRLEDSGWAEGEPLQALRMLTDKHVAKVAHAAIPLIMRTRVVGFHFDFRHDNIGRVISIGCSPVLRESTSECCEPAPV